MNKFRLCLALALVGSVQANAANPLRVPVRFSVANDAGLDTEWFVVGNHPDVGSWNPAEAIKLVWSEGNIWWGDVGIQAGTALSYKYVKRSTDPGQVCHSENAIWWPEGDNLQVHVPAEPAAPFTGKRIEFYSDMTNATLAYSMLSSADFNSTSLWMSTAMANTGPGLRAGEWRHVVEGVGTEGEWIRFTLNGYRNGSNVWEGAWDGQDYWTSLDALAVRDRQIFNYEPPAVGVSASRVLTTNVGSSVDGIEGRDVRIYLPRGYAENPNRRYPVVYMSDGENVFQPGGTFGCWNADTTADSEIMGGRMREAIIVGVPSAADRTVEYLPHMDRYDGQQGKANLYADFLIHNVRPTIDYHYRTKNDRANTACIGSSSGGLLAMYLGTWTNSFGMVGALSGVYDETFCPNYMAWLAAARPHDARIWMDVGNVGGELDIDGLSLYQSNFDLYWYLAGMGYVPNVDLRFTIGCGHDHNEAAWAARLPFVYRFLLDVRNEPNELLRRNMTLLSHELSFPAYRGAAYSVEQVPSMGSTNWTALTNWARETAPWTQRTVRLPVAADAGFFRVKGE